MTRLDEPLAPPTKPAAEKVTSEGGPKRARPPDRQQQSDPQVWRLGGQPVPRQSRIGRIREP